MFDQCYKSTLLVQEVSVFRASPECIEVTWQPSSALLTPFPPEYTFTTVNCILYVSPKLCLPDVTWMVLKTYKTAEL